MSFALCQYDCCELASIAVSGLTANSVESVNMSV